MIVDVESVAQTDVAPPILVKAVDPAVPPDEPFYPRVLPNVLVGGLLGLLLGVGLVLLRAVLDRTVRTQQGLEKVVGGPMLAKVPQDRSMKDELFVALNQHSYNSEGFRMLRANLEFVDPDHNPRIIAVASAQASEGKTTVACNLAITLATAGNRVCLVDADLRRGTVANVLGIESSVGLSDVLARRVDPKEAALKWRRGLLTVLPTGSKAPNPSELLGSATMQKLLKLLRESFDYVILDTSPITVVSDPKYVVAMAEGTIVVARYGITTWNQLKTTKDEIDRVGGRILGSVFNGVPDGSRSYGYYSSYHSTKDIKQPSEDIAMDAVARN